MGHQRQMTGSNRTFTYALTPVPEDRDRVLKKATKILAMACDGDSRITCHGITGEALGIITISLTIKGRDQWWSRQLAQDIVNFVTWGLEPGVTQLDLESRRQEAHTHRGYAHGRTKRYRESKPERTTTSASSSTGTTSGDSSAGSSQT